MVVFSVFLGMIAIVVLMLGLSIYFIVGRERLGVLRREFRSRLREDSVYLVVLIVVLAINSLARGMVADVSWIIGWNLTGAIFRFEGTFVAWLQSFANPLSTAYFSFIYVYGYAYLLIFPIIAYAAIETSKPLRELISAYVINYIVGLVFYALFVSYGPRNLMPDLVDSLLYTTYPHLQFLTRIVNTNTNVFPSLHTSLATTVAVCSYRTRTVYPKWFPVAVFIAGSVLVATMYLGIHWAADVVAGVVLGVASVKIAVLFLEREWGGGIITEGSGSEDT